MPEYIEHIDQYNDMDECLEDDNEKNVIWSLEYSKLCENLMDIFEFYRKIDTRFEYLGISSLYSYRNNVNRNIDIDLKNLSKDIYEEIQFLNNKFSNKINIQNDNDEDFKELIKLINYTEKNIYSMLFNELTHYIIY